MALYRLSMRTISRGRGELAVATAAYIAGERLYLEREHWTYDWRWRADDVLHAELFGAYRWSREELWNQAEWAERRWDGVTAREITLAMPCELSLEEQTKLAREFARWLRRRYRVAVDLAIHAPSRRAGRDERNVHAHILITVRVMSPSGLQERTHVWDHKRTGGAELRRVRSKWREMINAALERAGLDVRVDERSYKDQGLERLPGVHLGPVLSELERGGTPTAAGDYNRTVDILNRIRAAVGPALQWDWAEKARSFSDQDGHLAHAACRAKLYGLVQAEETLIKDPRALSPDKVREIRVTVRELVALQRIIQPARDARNEERTRIRKQREKERKRSRTKSRGRD